MTSRQDIEPNYCPKCRGAWLDSGELGKIIERSQREETAVATPTPIMQPTVQPVRDDYSGDYGHGGERHSSDHGGARQGDIFKRLFY